MRSSSTFRGDHPQARRGGAAASGTRPQQESNPVIRTTIADSNGPFFSSSQQQQPSSRQPGPTPMLPSNRQPTENKTNNNNNNNPLLVVRQRANSSGSTRGAFYSRETSQAKRTAPVSVKEIVLRRRSSTHKNSKHQQQPRQSQQQQPQSLSRLSLTTSMADVAALAMESLQQLEPGDMQPLDSTQPFAQPYHDDHEESSTRVIQNSKAAAARRALLQAQQTSSRRRPSSSSAASLLLQPSLSGDNSLDYSGNVHDAAVPNYKRQGSGGLLGDALLESPAPSSRRASPNINNKNQQKQQTEIDQFAKLVQSFSDVPPDYGATSSNREEEEDDDYDEEVEEDEDYDNFNNDMYSNTEIAMEKDSDAGIGWWRFVVLRIQSLLDPTEWLSRDVQEDGLPPSWGQCYTLAALVRHLFYNPISPEFTSLQLFDWSVLIGIAMGLYTAGWKKFIEIGIDFFWDTVPTQLMEWGVFSELDGAFPIYHYMWICPAFFGGLLSYIFVQMPQIPDQNHWNTSIHTRGVLDHETLVPLFLLSTMSMWSGLSLGPELPLVLTASMAGSWLGLQTHQSMLQARVLNMTAASAAVGGFFGFPMAGALFVLEIPHRMGLQYFEALSPGTIASIVSVLVNRMVIGNEVTGYYKYPFLTTSLPSSIFSSAIVYGLYGSVIGIIYVHGIKFFKGWVQSWFLASQKDHAGHIHDRNDSNTENDVTVGTGSAEMVPLISAKKQNTLPKSQPRINLLRSVKSCVCFAIPNKAYRATLSGIVAGAMVGVVGIFLPHTMFWGEAQLQNLIDQGRTPLPVFGQDSDDNNNNDPTVGFLAHAMCMIDPMDKEAVQAGFGLECSAVIAVAKLIVIGLSLGTGIIGGHFWGPLYVACAASHFFSDFVKIFDDRFGFGGGLATYPCVVMLCTMGSAHVVPFRAHMAIMLILTLTISAFDPEDLNSPFEVAGDYSAVFPLLVVSVFISLMTSRNTVFYPTQRSRGDITAVPEVLCQPGKSGAPLVVVHEHNSEDWSNDDDGSYSDNGSIFSDEKGEVENVQSITQNDIENAFEAAKASGFRNDSKSKLESSGMTTTSKEAKDGKLDSTSVERNTNTPTHRRIHSAPLDNHPVVSPSRRNIQETRSLQISPTPLATSPQVDNRPRTTSTGSQSDLLMRVQSFGRIQQHQPSLMDQARLRAASSVAVAELSPSSSVAGILGQHRRVPSLTSNPPGSGGGGGRHRRIPSLPMASRDRTHSRQNSQNSPSFMQNASGSEPEAMSSDDFQDKLMSNSLWSNSSQQGSISMGHSRETSPNSPSMMMNALGAEPDALSADDIQLANEKFMAMSHWSTDR